MGTHPIFESDFDCLTECQPQLPVNHSATNHPTASSSMDSSAAAVRSACPAKSAGAHAWFTNQLKKEWAAITLEHAASFLSSLFSSLSDGLESPAFSDKKFESDMESKEVLLVTLSRSGAVFAAPWSSTIGKSTTHKHTSIQTTAQSFLEISSPNNIQQENLLNFIYRI